MHPHKSERADGDGDRQDGRHDRLRHRARTDAPACLATWLHPGTSWHSSSVEATSLTTSPSLCLAQLGRAVMWGNRARGFCRTEPAADARPRSARMPNSSRRYVAPDGCPRGIHLRAVWCHSGAEKGDGGNGGALQQRLRRTSATATPEVEEAGRQENTLPVVVRFSQAPLHGAGSA